MKSSRGKLRAIASQALWGHPGLPLSAISIEELKPLADEMEGVIVEEATPVIVDLVNVDDTPEALKVFREQWRHSRYPLTGWTDGELLKFRDEMRQVWLVAEQRNLEKQPDESKLEPIWKRWFSAPLDDAGMWWPERLAGRLVPLPQNIRAIAGRVLIDNSKRLARCANEPECKRFFIKDRKDSRYCLEQGCRKYAAGRDRTKTWRANKSKLTRAPRPRKGH